MKCFSKAKGSFDSEKKEDLRLIDHVRSGDVDYIKTVDPNVLLRARDKKHGDTVLMIATKEKNLTLCKEILKKCPSIIYKENKVGETVLLQAIDTSSSEIFWFIDHFVKVGVGVDEHEKSKKEGDINMKFESWMKKQDLRGDTALLKAVRYGYLHVVKRFVELDCEYELSLSKVVGFQGKTALNWAKELKDHEMEKLLTDAVHRYSDFVKYATAMSLFDRVESGDLDYIKTVAVHELLNSRDQHRMSVLSIATRCDRLDCCKEILKRCPSLLYHRDNQKWSVLHRAADLKIYRLIDFFVSFGLEAAKSDGGAKIHFRNWINLQNSPDHDTALILAVIRRSCDMVKRFAEVDRQYKLGLSKIIGYRKRTALQWARHYKDDEMIKMLTDSGDPNLDDDNVPIEIAIPEDQESLQTKNNSGAGAASESKIFTFDEVSKHNKSEDCWILINNKVYDVTKFWGGHPGGSEVLLKASGKDATTDFENAHNHSTNAVTMMDKFYVGVCDSITSSLSKLASDKLQPYSRAQLKEFTKDFSQLLGSGGFGDVYKGQFPNDGVFIAIKVLKNIESIMEKVMQEQFLAEVETMGRACHRNLIKLHGYCYEANTKYKALVYEYMENGSFYEILFKKTLDISWAKLHNIAKEIAMVISYLHEGCDPIIIHQDIKPANVLIDSNLSPKVIDFGCARVINMGESQFEQTKIKGTRGYMAPETNQQQKVKLSSKLDVYSFGMILFDILGSKRNHVDKRLWFPGQVWKMYKAGQLEKFILDCGIKEEDKKNAKRLATIALLCVEHDPQNRPNLSDVVKMLEGAIIPHKTPVTPFSSDYVTESCSTSDSRDH